MGGLEEPQYGEPSNWAHCKTVAHYYFFFQDDFHFKKKYKLSMNNFSKKTELIFMLNFIVNPQPCIRIRFCYNFV